MLNKLFAKKTPSEPVSPSPSDTNSLPPNAFQIALNYHQQGELAKADELYRQILQQNPNHFEALHFLGVLAYQVGQHQPAIELITKAIELQPDYVDAHNNLGNVLAALNDIDAAIASFQRVIALKPDYSQVYNNLGCLFKAQGKLAAAIESFQNLLRLDPYNAAGHYNLGVALHEQGQLEQAAHHYQQAISIHPNYAEAYYNLAIVCNQQSSQPAAIENFQQAIALKPDYADAYAGLGLAFKEQGDLSAAVESYRQAVSLNPANLLNLKNLAGLLQQQNDVDAAIETYHRALTISTNDAEIYNHLGVALWKRGEFDEAVIACQRAIMLNPNSAEAHFNLAAVLKDQNKLEQAIESCQKAIAITPDYIDAFNKLGLIFESQGKRDEALSCFYNILTIRPNADSYFAIGSLLSQQFKFDSAIENYQKALALKPDYSEVALNLGILLLSQGRYLESWQYYEARYHPSVKNPNIVPPYFLFPQWRGESLVGKSLVVWYEQGLGDEIQFCRYVTVLKSHGARHVTWACQKPLKPLFKTLKLVDAVFSIDEADKIAAHDYWAFALSLPLHCNTTLDNIPATTPYLYANPDLMKKISAELSPISEFKIGICWKGNPNHKNDKNRSPGISLFSGLFNLLGVKFVTLQPDTRAEFLAAAGAAGIDRGREIEISSFEEAAALMMNLDLVITCDTSICHLAGALGKPVWLLLPFKADWRWLMDREDSPWYPKTRLFRQSQAGDWREVFQRVETELKQVLAVQPNHL